MPGGKKRTKAEYVALFKEFERSGLKLTAFAEERGIPYSTLAMWRKRLRDGSGPRQRPRKKTTTPKRARRRAPKLAASPINGSTPLLPVELALSGSPNGTGAARRFEVVLGSGCVVRVPVGFDVGELRRLLQALEAAEC